MTGLEKTKLGPQGERDTLYMRDPWYMCHTSQLKTKGLRGVPEYHNNGVMLTYTEPN